MRRCTLDKMDMLFAALSEGGALYLPVEEKDGSSAYKRWEEGTVWSDKLNTVRSPKDFFFPQSENLMSFKIQGQKIELRPVEEEQEDFVIFGVRACDVRSFDILDRVFLSQPADSFYGSRRGRGTVISLACTRPSESCFCKTFGIDPAQPAGDISAWKTGSHIYFDANTGKGESLLNRLSDLLEECGTAAVAAQKEKINAVMDRLPLKDLSTEGFGGGRTGELFESPAWAELSQSCLGCGTCTFVCPTCQCYDIQDFNTGSGVLRFRCWDSCMYSEFTKMAHGNNRLTQKERFRQRFMHKLVYFPENNGGVFGCVGCGRCLAGCPISMSIVKVMKRIGGSKDA